MFTWEDINSFWRRHVVVFFLLILLLYNLTAMAKDYRRNISQHTAAILVSVADTLLSARVPSGTWLSCDKTQSRTFTRRPWMLNIIMFPHVEVWTWAGGLSVLYYSSRSILNRVCASTFIRIPRPLPVWFSPGLLNGKLAQDITYGSNKHLVQIGLIKMALGPQSSTHALAN